MLSADETVTLIIEILRRVTSSHEMRNSIKDSEEFLKLT